jgi:hypothetical protein
MASLHTARSGTRPDDASSISSTTPISFSEMSAEQVQGFKDDMAGKLSVISFDPDSGRFVWDGPDCTLSVNGYATLVFPAALSEESRSVAPTCAFLDQGVTVKSDGASNSMTISALGEDWQLYPVSQAEERDNWLLDLEWAENLAKEFVTVNPSLDRFSPISVAQSLCNDERPLPKKAVQDINKAYTCIQPFIKDYWPTRLADLSSGEGGEENVGEQVAMIAGVAILVVDLRREVPSDPSKALALWNLEQAVRVGQFHRRIVLRGYPEVISEMAQTEAAISSRKRWE